MKKLEVNCTFDGHVGVELFFLLQKSQQVYALPFWSRSSRKPGTLAFGHRMSFSNVVPVQVQKIQISGFVPKSFLG